MRQPTKTHESPQESKPRRSTAHRLLIPALTAAAGLTAVGVFGNPLAHDKPGEAEHADPHWVVSTRTLGKQALTGATPDTKGIVTMTVGLVGPSEKARVQQMHDVIEDTGQPSRSPKVAELRVELLAGTAVLNKIPITGADHQEFAMAHLPQESDADHAARLNRLAQELDATLANQVSQEHEVTIMDPLRNGS